MSAMVERHDTIVRSAIEDHDGFVFATGGDAFSAVFRSAQEALAAAVTAQLLITGEDWGEVEPLRVRMGVHTGEAEERDDNYFGPAVNESARLMSAGHGGQILVSETAQRIVGDRLPDGVVLVDLGEHRLKDVDDPIVVYQVTHIDLAVEFPALRGWADTRNNLPSQLTSFVGRERELIELEMLRRSLRVDQAMTDVGGRVELGPVKTSSSRRTVKLPRFLVDELAQHLAAFPSGAGLVFSAERGGPIRRTNFRRREWLPAIADSVGVPCRFHDLRHSHAALLIADGSHPKVIQARLGHSSIRTTLDTYGHLFDGLDEAAADRLDASYQEALADSPRTVARS
jgi:hypothetical protein